MAMKQKQSLKRLDFEYEAQGMTFGIVYIDTGVDKMVTIQWPGGEDKTFDFGMLCDLVDSVRAMQAVDSKGHIPYTQMSESLDVPPSPIQEQADHIQRSVDEVMRNDDGSAQTFMSLSGVTDPTTGLVVEELPEVPETPPELKKLAEEMSRRPSSKTGRSVRRKDDTSGDDPGELEVMEI